MPSVTIDAGVLSSPPEHGSADDVRHYVDALLDWNKLLGKPWVTIYMSALAAEALINDGLYPLRDQLQRLFRARGIVEYDVNTVATVVDRLLHLTPSFEDYFSIRDVLFEDLTTKPDIIELCSGTTLQSDLARCTVLVAILRQHCREPIRHHSLIVRRAPGRSIRVRAQITHLEHQRSDLNATPVPPEYFEGDVLVCDNFRGLIECLDEAAILLQATDELGIETAIRIAVYKARLARNTAPEWDNMPSLSIGRGFRSSLQGIPVPQQLAPRLLRAIIETVEQTDMAATHWLRTGRGGDDPQRVRGIDQAKAWRRDIDREHHLHYWICGDGSVEIGSVSFPHDDFTIPE